MQYEDFIKELNSIMQDMGKQGNIFRNEKQFQFDLAWKIKEKLRLNVHFEAAIRQEHNEYIDLVVDDNDKCFAIELKYKTGAYNKNGIELTLQSAGNNACYDFWRDVKRIENLLGRDVYGKKCVGGAVVMLSNYKWYWAPKTCHQNSMHYPLRLVDRKVDGTTVNWNGELEKHKTRGTSLELTKTYILGWQDYIGEEFRYLLLPITN